MHRKVWVIASLLALGACTETSNTTATSPSADGPPDSSDSGPSTSKKPGGGDPLAADSGSDSGSGFGSSGPAPNIAVLPCHLDEGLAAPKTDAAAPPKPGAKPVKSTGDANPPTVKQPISVSPKELAWNIDTKRLAAIYDKQIDGDFKERYKKAQPGPDMQALDAEVQEQKDVFRRSVIDFGTTPTGIDATPLKGEYTYNNSEAMMRITRSGKTRDFFFIGGKLWKLVDELPLGEKSQWGNDFQEAVVKISQVYGIAGRVCPADPEHGRMHREVDWRDSNTHVRAVDTENGKFALTFLDLGTWANLSNLRKAAATTSNGVDPSVQDIMHTPQPPPAKDDKKKK